MLEARGVQVAYGPVRAVNGIDLEVGEGEVVALIGPNGAGKTSLLRAISGLVPYRGAINYDGQDCRRLRVEGVARRGLIHVPEGRRVIPTLNVRENLLLGTAANRRRRAALGLDDVYDLFPALRPLHKRAGWTLSGGEQQMVALGRALVAGPRLLLLDEPSLGLAPKLSRAVFAALGEISARVPMLLVEQNTALALEVSTRAAVVVGGRIVLSGTAEELGDREALVASYLGEEPALTGHSTGDDSPGSAG
jgi:branched-chain amino acid transport system ATP-binding protein